MKPPTIAIDARLLGTQMTGDATYWNGLIRGLQSVPSDHQFLLISNNEKPAWIPESDRFVWIEVKSRRSRWWSLFRFPLKARRLGAQVIHTQYNVSPLAGSHSVTTVHDVSFMIKPDWFRPSDRVILQRFVPPSMRRSSRVITVSQTSALEIAQHFPDIAHKIRVTPLALNPAIQPIPADVAQLQVKQDWGLDDPYLLTVGTQWPRKNTALAIEMMNYLEPELPHKLVVTGKAGWGETAEHPRIVRTGYVSDEQLSALYSGASLYISPSFHEGFGLTLLEAFASRVPVICGRGGALPEVAGDAALVMPDYSANTWGQECSRLLKDSGKLLRMQQLGLKRLSDFSWEKTAKSTLEVYQEAIHEL